MVSPHGRLAAAPTRRRRPPRQAAASATVAGEAQFEARFELPDGQSVTLGAERFRCAEALFRPELAGADEGGGLHQMVVEAVSRCDASLRAEMKAEAVKFWEPARADFRRFAWLILRRMANYWRPREMTQNSS